MGAGSHLVMGFAGGVQWVRAQGPEPRGIVFAPPLIGGHALQQIRMLRLLVPRGFDVVSFSYAGHGDSSGTFSFQAALDNCLSVLDWSRQRSLKEGLPLFGVASCFGALPMIHAAAERGEPLGRMALINAVPHWRWEKLVFEFLQRWSQSKHGWLSLSGIKTSMHQYLEDLFPRVAHGRRSFGILSRSRVHWLKMMGELWNFRRRSQEPLASTPVLCAYGRQDRLLQQMGFADWSVYETNILDMCPQASFWRLDSDHFLSCPTIRLRLIRAVVNFFSRNISRSELVG